MPGALGIAASPNQRIFLHHADSKSPSRTWHCMACVPTVTFPMHCGLSARHLNLAREACQALKPATLPCRTHVAARVDNDDKASVAQGITLSFARCKLYYFPSRVDRFTPFPGLAGLSVLCQHGIFVVAKREKGEKNGKCGCRGITREAG